MFSTLRYFICSKQSSLADILKNLFRRPFVNILPHITLLLLEGVVTGCSGGWKLSLGGQIGLVGD